MAAALCFSYISGVLDGNINAQMSGIFILHDNIALDPAQGKGVFFHPIQCRLYVCCRIRLPVAGGTTCCTEAALVREDSTRVLHRTGML